MKAAKALGNVAYINPKILSWARKRSGQSYAELEPLLRTSASEVASWERGETLPPFDKARRIAELLRIPFGYLFLSKPPDLPPELPDLRTLDDRRPLSLNFLEVVNDSLVKQDWYRDYQLGINSPPLKFIGGFTRQDDTEETANDIRRVLGMTAALRRSAKDWADYLSKLVSRAEDAGVLVMRSGVVGNTTRRKLSSGEFQGFALSDSYAPFVFVNSEDYKAAQVFTFLHELAHLWIGTSAISHIDPSVPKPSNDPIELYCNSVAVEALVPRNEFEQVWVGSDIELLTTHCARTFWVSTLVILRRALELEKITRADFLRYIELEKKRYKRQRATGGNYYRNVVSRMGSQFTKAVVSEVRAGNLLYRDAARLLKLKVPTFNKLSEQFK